jgi:hypothetical protein
MCVGKVEVKFHLDSHSVHGPVEWRGAAQPLGCGSNQMYTNLNLNLNLARASDIWLESMAQ